MENEPKPTIEHFEEGTVVHLNPEAQAQEHMDSAELMETLTERYDALAKKIVDEELNDQEIANVQKEMNEIEEQRAQIESQTAA